MKLEQPWRDVVDHKIKPVFFLHLPVASRGIHDVRQVHIFIEVFLRADECIEDVPGQYCRPDIKSFEEKRQRIVAVRVEVNDVVLGMASTQVAAVE